jgi:hypothetical protein
MTLTIVTLKTFMSALGSLPFFLAESCKFKHLELSEKREKIESRVQTAQQEHRPSKCIRTLSGLTQFDSNTEGFIYVSVHKDPNSLLRIGSAAPTSRSVQKPKIFHPKNSKNEVKSRISARRDPSEMKVSIPKTVKMQEKIRNELL